MGSDDELNPGKSVAKRWQDALLPASVKMLFNLINEDNAVGLLWCKLPIKTIQAHTTKGQVGDQGHHAAEAVA
jgi:hypothetical protein